MTGAAGDLGCAIGLALAADGWGLLLADHPSRADRLEATRAACQERGAEVEVACFDVTRHAEVAGAVATSTARHGPPTAVVANAGVQGDVAPVHAADPVDAARVLEVNVLGVFNTVNVCARAMIDAGAGGGGAIATMASMAGVSGAPNMPAYSASKAAVIGLAKSAAKDLAPFGIRVNAISPAFIGPGSMWDNQVARQATAGSQYFDSDPEVVARQMVEMIPMRRCGTPAEVADVVGYLVGDRSSYLTGINVEVGGGSV